MTAAAFAAAAAGAAAAAQGLPLRFLGCLPPVCPPAACAVGGSHIAPSVCCCSTFASRSATPLPSTSPPLDVWAACCAEGLPAVKPSAACAGGSAVPASADCAARSGAAAADCRGTGCADGMTAGASMGLAAACSVSSASSAGAAADDGTASGPMSVSPDTDGNCTAMGRLSVPPAPGSTHSMASMWPRCACRAAGCCAGCSFDCAGCRAGCCWSAALPFTAAT